MLVIQPSSLLTVVYKLISGYSLAKYPEYLVQSRVVANRDLILHQYANDCQVYTSTLQVNNAAAAVNLFSRCLDDVEAWMSSSLLLLN